MHICLSGTKSKRYYVYYYWGLSPHTYTKKNKKRNVFPVSGYLQRRKVSRLANGQHLRTFGQMEVKRLKASGIFGLLRVRIEGILWGELGGKDSGIITHPKPTKPHKQQHPQQPEHTSTSKTHKEDQHKGKH